MSRVFHRETRGRSSEAGADVVGTGRRALGGALFVCCLCLLSTSVAVAFPAWLPATDLSAPGRDADNPAVAMDSAGETVAIWERQSGISRELQLSTRAPGANFSAPVELSPASNEPVVAMTPGGETIAAWRHFDLSTGNNVIQLARRAPGGSFSAPANVSVSETNARPQGLRVAVNATGDAAVVWKQKDPASPVDPNQFFIEAAVCPAGGSCSVPAIVSSTPLVLGDAASGPAVSIDGGGNAFVVWGYFDGTDHLVQAATGSPAGVFSPPLQLSPGGAEASEPEIAADVAGDATAVWTQSDGTNFIIQNSTLPVGGSFSAPEPLSEPGVDASSPLIAAIPSGAAMVVWTATAGTGTAIEAVARAPGALFSPPETISTAGESAIFPTLAMNPGGSALAAWSGLSGGEDIVRAAIRSGEGKFSAPVGVAATDAGFFHPEVALDQADDATAVWSRSDGSNTIIQAAGYDADAPQLRAISVPTSGKVGVPVAVSVSPFDVWPISSTGFVFGDGAVAVGSSATHTYAVRGTFPVTVRATDAAGTPVEAERTIAIGPSGEFSLGKLSRNKRKGTATLVVDVSSSGRIALSGKGVRRTVRRVEVAKKVKLPIAPTSKSVKRLKAKGKAKVRLRIVFTPDGGSATAKPRTVVLIKKP